MSSVFQRWMVHRCDVDTPTGDPDRWGERPVTTHTDVPCLIEGGVTAGRDDSGSEIVGALKVSVELEYAEWFPIGARVTARGRSYEVDAADIVDDDAALNGATFLLK